MSYVVVLSKRRLLAAGEIVLALARAWESKLREYDPRAQLFSSGVRAEVSSPYSMHRDHNIDTRYWSSSLAGRTSHRCTW